MRNLAWPAAAQKAAATHQLSYMNAMAGRGLDRHLFALYIVARGTNTESPFLSVSRLLTPGLRAMRVMLCSRRLHSLSHGACRRVSSRRIKRVFGIRCMSVLVCMRLRG